MKLSSKITIIGIFILIVGFLVMLFTFLPIIKLEIDYYFHTKSHFQSNSQLVLSLPKDSDFVISIPKINAVADVIADVDTNDPKIYNQALTKGVAHAKGTSLPGEVGNIFIFSHSSANFYEARKYNSIFYLLNKLEKEDVIEIMYKNQIYKYKVTGKEIIKPDEYSGIDTLLRPSKRDFEVQEDKETLTLMTCWPPGTSLRRLIVITDRI